MNKLSLKICIVSPGFHGGGAEDMAIKCANFYYKKKYEVYFLTFHNRGVLRKRLNLKIPILFIKMDNIFSMCFSNKLKQYNFDHVISFIRHTNIASFFAKKFGTLKTNKLHLIEVNTFDRQKELSVIKRFLQNLILKFVYNNAQDVIAVSNLVKEQIRKKFKTFNNVRVIGNPCIEEDLLKKINKKKKIKNYHRFVAAGRLHHQKDFLFLLNAFKKLKNINKKNKDTLTIYGSGPEYKKIKKFIKYNNLSTSIRLKGFVNEIEKKLVNYDAFILSSKFEGFGIVIIMAMNAGLPVIARANSGGPDDLINKKNGFLFKNENKLVKILNSFHNYKFSLRELKKLPKKYTVEAICLKYLKG